MKAAHKIGAVLAALAIWAGASARAHGALVFNLDHVVSGGTPGGVAPWLRATITQFSPTQVYIHMEALNLVASSSVTEAVKEWAFNLNPDIPVAQLSAEEVARTGSFLPNPLQVLARANGYAGFSFDFDFEFATGGNANKRFTLNDSVTVRLTRDAGLLVSDFAYAAEKDGLELYSAAHILSLEGGASSFVGAVVPEPSTIIAGALLLLPLGAIAIRAFPNR